MPADPTDYLRAQMNSPQPGTKVPTWADLMAASRDSPAVRWAVFMAERGELPRETALIGLALHLARVVQDQQAELVRCRELSLALHLDCPPGWAPGNGR